MHLLEPRKAHEQTGHPIDFTLEGVNSFEERMVHDLEVGGDAVDLGLFTYVFSPEPC